MTYLPELVAGLTEDQPEVVELARCLSLAVSVDRGFLRRARLRFLPRTTAGLEAELWFSPLVEAAGRQALLLDPEAAEYLRTELARTAPESLREIRAFTAVEHAHAPLVVRLYEDLLWSGLGVEEVEEARLNRHMARVLRTVSGQDVADEVADDMGRWALHYAHRLPGHVLRRDDLWDIQVASRERLGLEPPEDPEGRPTSVTARARARVQHAVPLGVTVRSDGIVLSRPPAAGARVVRARGTRHKVRLDVRSSLSHTAEPVRLDLPPDQSLHLPFTVVQRIGPEGDVRMSLSHPGTALDIAVSDHLGTGEGAAHCAVLLPDGTIVLHDGNGAENRRIPAESARNHVYLSKDGKRVSYLRYGDELEQMLVLDSPYVPDVPRRLRDEGLRDGALHFRSGEMVVQALADGRITVGPAPEGDTPRMRVIGHAPWRVSFLAISPDERWVAVVGNDSLLLELPVDAGRPRETRLRFCATWVSACADGSWIVVGHGGPVDLRTEDGSGFRVLPDTEPAADGEDGVPSWGRGCALVETGTAPPTELAALPGVECLLVRPGDAPPETDREFAAAHEQGVRVVVGVDLTATGDGTSAGVPEGQAEDALGVVRHWLDADVDGLSLSGVAEAPHDLLDDIRHLAGGYDDRMLLWDHAPPAGDTDVPHVAPASSLTAALEFALSYYEVPGRALEQAIARLRNEIGSTFPPPRTSRARAAFQWGLALPPTLSPALGRLGAAILLSLPGCPVVPGSLLLRDDADRPDSLSALLELRRDHLALSRGECEVVDAGGPQVLAVVRRHGDDAMLCLVNIARTPARATVAPVGLGGAARLQDAFDTSFRTLADGATIPLQPGGVRWFRLLAP
ncbi:DUF3459 domain-containing protein [Streptomyces sp. NPDC046909]|uniref:DUF3459 domain-containing protein n=1 Tax=Streptomyces sp. NPDC046909 TaxID=3155617 RepID=UPI0033DA7585